MAEFTFTFETPEGGDVDDDALGRFFDAITASPWARGGSALVDQTRGVLSSRFQIDAATMEEAKTTAIRAFTDALATARLRPSFQIVEAIAGTGDEDDAA